MFNAIRIWYMTIVLLAVLKYETLIPMFNKINSLFTPKLPEIGSIYRLNWGYFEDDPFKVIKYIEAIPLEVRKNKYGKYWVNFQYSDGSTDTMNLIKFNDWFDKI